MSEIMIKGYQCERCGHIWTPAGSSKPRVCPKCKSPYWDTPRKTYAKNMALSKFKSELSKLRERT